MEPRRGLRPAALVVAFFATLASLGVLALATPSRAVDCQDVSPFINEFDYDSNDGFPNDDRDEFVEIAAPIGADLSGLQVLVIEGNPGGLFGLPCSTGFGVDAGDPHFVFTLPAGSVVPDPTPLDPDDDTMGVFVVCFDVTSGNIIAQGNCDVIADSPFDDSTLKNGHLTNGNDYECPDGILLLDAVGGLLDTVSYEGIVPAQGTYGALFNAPNPSYQTPRDEGFSVGESIRKTTSTVSRATSGSEWALSGSNQASPGSVNPGQSLACEDIPAIDSDGDGVFDAVDSCPLTPNPLQEDADGDGVGDVCDNCPDDPNADQADADMDGEGDVCECDPNPGPGYWEVTYDLAGSEFETRNTPFGAGDAVHVIGPGTATIRFEADGTGPGGNILDGGSASFVQLDQVQYFEVNVDVLGVTADVVTDLVASIPDDRWNGNPLGVVDPGSSSGTLSGTQMTLTSPPGLASYNTLGTVTCTGSGCSTAGYPDGTPVAVDDTIDLGNFTSVTFGAGGPVAGASWDSNEIALPPQESADPFLRLTGAEISRVYVPGEPGEVCEVDTDGDGFPDDQDNCPAVPNDQSDVNGDGFGDACQPDDPDGDGWPDAEDNCPNDANADQSDLNGDGVGDVCQASDPDGDGWPDAEDSCPAVANPSQADADADGVGDACDNCPAVSNPGQEDANGDGAGDVCQPDDADGDGWPDAEDSCPLVANASQADADADGVGDACDNCVADPNPGQEDADADGTGDVCEDAPPASVPALPPWAWPALAAGLAAAGRRRRTMGRTGGDEADR